MCRHSTQSSKKCYDYSRLSSNFFNPEQIYWTKRKGKTSLPVHGKVN
uniref:Uncharacterized protein n=1 Tax=Anguilla anguilla TaxID=7936 RepID=A0A0E9T680_ANGAN